MSMVTFSSLENRSIVGSADVEQAVYGRPEPGKSSRCQSSETASLPARVAS
jgi:hypothetical protein